jgi:hypothetical protein
MTDEDDSVASAPWTARTGESNDHPTRPNWWRRPWTLRRWQLLGGAFLAVVLSVGVGVAAGTAGPQAELDDVREERDALAIRVNDREAQRDADAAKAKRIEQERQRTAEQQARKEAEEQQRQQAAAEEQARKEAEEQQRQQAAAAAEQQRQQAAAAEAARREAERQNTLPGDGVFNIGVDIQPGRFRTDGPSGGNRAGCYYAILNSPDTFDIATNNIVNGPATVDLPRGKFFNTTSCMAWHRQ